MTIVVPRHDEFQPFGWGLIKGLLVTGLHFVRSYLRHNRRIPGKELFDGGHYGIFTVLYPEEKAPLPDRYRGLPILLYDDESGAELCTACMACARACPVGIIHIEQGVDEEGKKIPYAEQYSMEQAVCINCGFCAANCNFGAIVMGHRLETAVTQRDALWVTKQQLLHPISHYRQIAPTVWAEIGEDAQKRLAGTVKRRPAGMGIVSPKH